VLLGCRACGRGFDSVRRPDPVAGLLGTCRYGAADSRCSAELSESVHARNPFSEIHNGAWQTDFYRYRGPLGRAPGVFSTYIQRECGSITFDRRGRLVAVCIGGAGPRLYMLDPHTLATLAEFALPPRQPLAPGTSLFQDFSGGGYFFLDKHDRVWSATTTHHLLVIAERGQAFVQERDYDLSRVLSSEENITSALPDSHGLMWFVTKRDGVVGTLQTASGRIRLVRLGRGSERQIENSFATDGAGGVYIATNRSMYRFVAGPGGRPRIVWQQRYRNSFQHKPGQVDDGTGTTPTVMPGGYVAVTDNADPMDVVVYRTAPHLRRGQRRVVCEVPVFNKGASDTENSLIGAGRSMIVEQLRVPRSVWPPFRRDHGAGVRARRHQPGWTRLPAGVDQPRRTRANGGSQTVPRDRAHLYLHA